MQNNDFDFEVKRKTFHLSSLLFPLLYLFTSKIFIVSFLLFLAIIVIYCDILRHYNAKIKYFVEKYFNSILREGEKSGSFALSGASFMILGFFTCAVLFSKGLAINCFCILIICDAFAAIIGKKIGSVRYYNNKTLEGSVAFFISAVLVSLLCYDITGYNTNFMIILISSVVATLVELYSDKLNINDNFAIPISFGLSSSLLSLLF